MVYVLRIFGEEEDPQHILRGIMGMYLLIVCHEASVMFVGEDGGFIEGRGSKSFIVGVG
jgi:hypothetical protein